MCVVVCTLGSSFSRVRGLRPKGKGVSVRVNAGGCWLTNKGISEDRE